MDQVGSVFMQRLAVVIMMAAMMAGMLAASQAHAQIKPGFRLNEEKTLTEEEIARNKANEDAAKAARATIPNAKVSDDPWSNVRGSDTAKPRSGAK